MLKQAIRFTNNLLPKRYRNNLGIWGQLAMAAIKYGPAVYNAVKGFSDSGEAVNVGEMVERPEYYEDPDYRQTQDYLKGYGMDILQGNIPDYYKAMGETGSPEFESMLDMTKRDISTSTEEALAKGGRARGGQLGASTAKAIGDASTTARFKDYQRSLVGKESLLGTGVGITEGVRDSGQREGKYVNKFNWDDYDARFTQFKLQQEMDQQAAEDKGGFLGNIMSLGGKALDSKLGKSILGKIGNIFSKNETSAVDRAVANF